MSNPFSRRGILALLTGASTAAAAGIKPKDVLAIQASMPIPQGPYSNEVSGLSCDVPWWSDHRWKLRNQLEQEYEKKFYRTGDLPDHIASKKSWSSVFKHSEAEKERRIYRDAIEALTADNTAEAIVLRFLGVSQ